MTIETYFHIGVIVPNLEQAMATYSRILGLTFTQPAVNTVPILEDPLPHEQVVHVAFSEDGPPYYELIEASGDGIFSARQEAQILYLGLWEPDMDSRMKLLAEQGIGLDAVARAAEGATPDWIITQPDILGIRLEYVNTDDRSGIERWVHTGVFTGLAD
jgi:catechol 2,3-dioxygenase-like lactoylglutathione lyase family enzyme